MFPRHRLVLSTVFHDVVDSQRAYNCGSTEKESEQNEKSWQILEKISR
jgi:hypothetical protein